MSATIPKKSPKRNGRMTRKRDRKKTRERNRRIFNERKRRILDRIVNRPGPERDQPMMTATNIHYELADRVQGLSAGGIKRYVGELWSAAVRRPRFSFADVDQTSASNPAPKRSCSIK